MEQKGRSDPLDLKAAKYSIGQYGRTLIKENDVNAVGIGIRTVGGKETGEISIKVFVSKKLPERLLPSWKIFPKMLSTPFGKDIYLDVEEMDKGSSLVVDTGVFQTPFKKSSRWMSEAVGTPSPGKSGSGIYSPVGTICICAKPKNSNGSKLSYFISCNHVLATFNRAPIGTPILQPSPADGGRFPQNEIGYLASFIVLKFGPTFYNIADVAIGHTNNPFGGQNFIVEIGSISTVGNVDQLVEYSTVRKIGRSTGITYGRVLAIHSLVKLDYTDVGTIGQDTIFENQIITTLMAAYGDSGSLLLDYNNNAIGMLFAGSATHTYFNMMEIILDSFGLVI